MNDIPMTIYIDSAEPKNHPWCRWFPETVTTEIKVMETGDMCVKGFEDDAVVERKTGSDFLGCLGNGRERFEKELSRSRYLGHFCVIVEDSLPGLMNQARQLTSDVIIGTISAWSRKFCPIILAGSTEYAAKIALRWMLQPIENAGRVGRRIERLSKQVEKQQTETNKTGVN